MFYYMRGRQFQHDIEARLVTTVQASIKRADMVGIPVNVPPLNIQKEIVDKVYAVDKKIQLSQKINQTLEQMAQVIFKSWFVDFEPVKAKVAALEAGGTEEDAIMAAMQAISGKDKAQLARFKAEQPDQYNELRTTAELFPSAMQDSESGEIPEGWRVGTLAELADLNKRSWTKKTLPSEIIYLDLSSAKNGVIENTEMYLSAQAPSRARRILSDGDTVIGTVRPGNRSFALIKNPGDNLTGSTGFAVLSPKRPELAEFIYIAATADESIEYFAHLADGGAYPAIRPEVIVKLTSIIPCEHLIEEFHATSRLIFDKASTARNESKNLSLIRDSLLPKLLSGELNISGSELEVESRS